MQAEINAFKSIWKLALIQYFWQGNLILSELMLFVAEQ